MSRGGYRPGAGRKPGTKSTRPTDEKCANAEHMLKTAPRRSRRFKSALQFAMEMINSADAPLDAKIRLAIAAMPFQSPKLAGAPLGKKEQAQRDAETAAQGSEWGDLLDGIDPAPERAN